MNTRCHTRYEIARTIASIPERTDAAMPEPLRDYYPQYGPTKLVVVSWISERRTVRVGYTRAASIVVVKVTNHPDGSMTDEEHKVQPGVPGRSLRSLVDLAIDWLLEDVPANRRTP